MIKKNDGFILINKDSGITSNGVINEIKKKIGIKKIGHSGTLDPNTTGLLVLAVGKATKFIPEITKDSHKTYIATMKYGLQTTTGDIMGEIVKQETPNITNEQIIETFDIFPREYYQVPPAFSAKKINGKRAYDLARDNPNLNMNSKVKKIKIYDLKILNIVDFEVEFKVEVSKGTYVRSLIEDIAQKDNNIATMTKLCRTQTDGFDIKDSHRITDDLYFINLEDYIYDKYPSCYIDNDKAVRLIKNGAIISDPNIKDKFELCLRDKIIAIYGDDKLLALYEKDGDSYKPYIML